MTALFTLLVLCAFACVIGCFVYGATIASELRSRGLSAHPMLIRFMIFRYLAVYKRVTLEETGEVGPLYQPCATFGTLSLVLMLVALAIRFL